MTELNWFTVLIGYLAGINAVTFVMVGFDKWMARVRAWRIPEAALWILTAIGGSAGMLFGMNTFRHKTRKVSFQFVIALILVAQAGIVYGIWYLFSR